MILEMDLNQTTAHLNKINCYQIKGRVNKIIGLMIEAIVPNMSLGELCVIERSSKDPLLAEAVGFKDESTVLLMPLGEIHNISPGSLVKPLSRPFEVHLGHSLLGRVIDGLGNPLDGAGPIHAIEKRTVNLHHESMNPLKRKRIKEILSTGIKSIDAFLTMGKGQRMGIFAGSGVGKSTLLGMLAKGATADVNVIALIGERGREVRDFIENNLDLETLKKTIVVAATSDQPALVRLKGAFVASTIAEYFRDQGKDVLLMMDSVTRFAMAQREIGLAAGEPPTSKGYTPSVFTLLPKLLERAGTNQSGSITGLYTVLVEGDDFNEPISDAVRAILDGHIMLTRQLARQGHYPCIDILDSVSRLMSEIVDKAHLNDSYQFREVLANYKESKDLIDVGAYVKGSNPKIDIALKVINDYNQFLKQDVQMIHSWSETVPLLKTLAQMARA